MEGGRGYKIHLDRAGSCVQMVEVPSTALDMGNEEHHHGNWRASQDIQEMSPGRVSCLVTLQNSFPAPHCFVGESEGLGSCSNLCIVRYVMENLILLGINCDADYTGRYTGLSWCVVWAVCRVTWCWGDSQFVPNFETGADCGLTLIIWISRAEVDEKLWSGASC